jgi:hypothetical protein
MGRKRWWHREPKRVPVLYPGNYPGGQATMPQFLPVPAKDETVSVAGFVKSRSHGFGR